MQSTKRKSDRTSTVDDADSSGAGHRTAVSGSNPLNIDSSSFDCETYLSKLLKEKSIYELMDYENNMVDDIKKLDSEMQTLVYENYNKFIAATDTIRKMKQDFVQMEEEMDKLAQNMNSITSFSEQVSNTLGGNKENVQKLVKSNNTLKNLEYILDLPAKMSEYCERKEFTTAVKAYKMAEPVLEKYKDLASFRGIYGDCQLIISDLKDQLKERFKSKAGCAKDLALTVHMLLQLGEPAPQLSDEYLKFSKIHIEADLIELREQVKLKSGDGTVDSNKIFRPADAIPNTPMDVLEFIDTAASGFLSDTSLVVVSYNEMFIEKTLSGLGQAQAQNTVTNFVKGLMKDYFDTIEQRFSLEVDGTQIDDSSLMVRALDRFHRRLQAVSRLIPDTDFAESSVEIILRISCKQVESALQKLKNQFGDQLNEIRQSLVASRNSSLFVGRSTISPNSTEERNKPLRDLSEALEKSVQGSIKSAFASLLQFIACDVTFSSKPQFFLTFGVKVRECLCIGFFRHIIETCNSFLNSKGDKAFATGTLILILSRLCMTLESSMVHYMVNLCEQQYRIGSGSTSANPKDNVANDALTPAVEIVNEVRAMAQRLIDYFMELEGLNLSQLLSKSVETRDWFGCVEPRNVRAAVKRIVEELTTIDQRVSQLLEEGAKKSRSSNSSRTLGLSSIASRQLISTPNSSSLKNKGSSNPVALDNPLLKKLWSEKIDYFSSVDFTTISVLSGLVKIALKTLLECVRMKTYNKFGLQQIQVDCHYLELRLWRFVNDENLVHHLLEEVMTSAVSRCPDPTLLEPSVVDLICEKS